MNVSQENVNMKGAPANMPTAMAIGSPSITSSFPTLDTSTPATPTPSDASAATNTITQSPSIPNVASSQAFRALCIELRSLLQPLDTPEAKSQIANLDNSVQSILARLDEFSALIDSMRTNTHVISSSLLPAVLDQSAHLSSIYAKVDKLEEYVSHVEACTDQLESRVLQAENAYGELPTVQKFFSFMRRNVTDAPNSNATEAAERTVSSEPIEIVNAEDFFNIHVTSTSSQ